MPVVLFDLGGVLVESNGRSALQQLLPHLDTDQVLDRWNRSNAVGLFERGRMTEAEFAAAFIQEWELSMGEEVFLESFAAWVPGYINGATKLVRAIRGKHRVGCLSNTNAVHWKRMAELRGLFDFSFASHITGIMKPDREAYELVIDTLKAHPNEIHFFDDLQANVSAAREVGINAFLARSPQEVESILLSSGLLSHAGT
jgi:epoxide hydrolase-like predicted phosphatase